MPQGQMKFSELWLTSLDKNGQKLSEWCGKGQNEYYASCKFCDTQIQCDNAGKAQVVQHSTKKKHIEAMKHILDQKQSKLLFSLAQSGESSAPSTSKALAITFPDDDSLKAEVLWLLKLAVSNFSFRSTGEIGILFQSMFPYSKIAAKFSLGQTKSSYVISEGLLPYFTHVMVRYLLKSGLPFSLYFDETKSTQKKKQLDLTLRYWSTTHNEVWVTYYTLLFFGHAEAEKVLVKMYEQLLSDGIPVDKMATLIQDGPNVNKAIFRKMNELITQDHPDFMGLIDLGSCSIHIIHNAFGKGLEQYGKGIDQLCIDLY